MSRDAKKYWYAQVGIRRTQVLDHLRQEAEERGVPVSTHITDLLADRDAFVYGNGSKGIWIPRGIQVAMPVVPPLSVNGFEVKSIDEALLEENLDAFCGFLEEEGDDSPTEPHMKAI